MIDAPEIVEVTTRSVCCDGGGGALGHPKVYYTIGKEGYVDCGYCDRRFVFREFSVAPESSVANA